MRHLLFTDLDGTLLDHHTYSGEGAQRALHYLAAQQVPVIFCSSKTLAEQAFLQKKFGICYPFIVENGSAVAIPTSFFSQKHPQVQRLSDEWDLLVLSQLARGQVRQLVRQIEIQSGQHLAGFANSHREVIEAFTQLQGEAIDRACEKWYTETLFVLEIDVPTRKMLADAGLGCTRGGRFWTIQDPEVDKGRAVRVVTQLFENHWGHPPVTWGVGDSLNDLPLFQAVDRPFLVQRSDQTWAPLEHPRLHKIEAAGPYGFTELVFQHLRGCLS